MNKAYLFFLIAVSAGLGAIIYAEANTISELNRNYAALQAKEAALRAQADKDHEEIAKLKGQIATYKDESDALRKKLAAGGGADASAQAAPGTTAPAPAAGGGKGGEWMKNMAKMFTDPEMKKTMKAQQSMGIRMMYGDLFKQLGLSPQDAEQLADILAERQMGLSAAAMSALGANGQSDPEQAKKAAAATTEATKQYDEQLKATLGDANYKKFQDYEKTMSDRFMLQQFEGEFATAGAPLEPTQRENLLQIIQEERLKQPASPFNQTNNPQAQIEALNDQDTINRYFRQQEEINQRVLERARQTFSADQIAALQKVQQRSTDFMRSQMKMSQQLLGK